MNIPIDIKMPEMPSLPDIPDLDGDLGPGISDFEDFSTFTACTEKGLEYIALTLKLQSCTVTSGVLADKIRDVLKNMLGIQDNPFAISEMGEINMDLLINKISNPKINPLPKCLADTITGDIQKNSPGFGDILDPMNKSITEANSLTPVATGTLNSAAENLRNNVDSGVREVNKMMKKTMGNIIAPGDQTLFRLLDDFQTFIKDTNYIGTYNKWRDMYSCLERNCIPLKPFLIDDSFLYYDKEKKKFIVPIDINNGRVRVIKFFEEVTPSQQRKLHRIEQRYFKYLNDKKHILSEAARKAKIEHKVEDDKNPYLAVASNIETSLSKTVTTLF
jgi:hypothetical protein